MQKSICKVAEGCKKEKNIFIDEYKFLIDFPRIHALLSHFERLVFVIKIPVFLMKTEVYSFAFSEDFGSVHFGNVFKSCFY